MRFYCNVLACQLLDSDEKTWSLVNSVSMDLLCVVYRRLLMFHISCFVYGLTSSHFTLSEEYADSDNYIWHIPNGGKTPTIISEVPDVSPCTSQRHVLEDIGQEILRKLGLKAPPKVPNNSRNISHIKPLMALISAYEGYQRDSSPELEEDPSFQPETIILLANSSCKLARCDVRLVRKIFQTGR